MKYLKSYNESKSYISTQKEEEIFNLIDDCLIDIKDDDYNFQISKRFEDAPPWENDLVDTTTELFGQKLYVTIHRVEEFTKNDILDSVNNLISQLDGIDIHLKSIEYMDGSSKTWTPMKDCWYRMSLDPIDKQIKGNVLLKYDLEGLKAFRLIFN